MDVLASITANFLLYALLVLSLNNFIVGKTNIWPVGHIAFFGVGSLITGILISDHHVSAWLALVISLAIGICFSCIVGLASLRLTSDYFVILSIGLCELTRSASIYVKGPAGIGGIQRPSLFGFSLENDWALIVLVLAPVLVVVIFLAFRFKNSPLERVCILIRQDEAAAKLLRIPITYYKVGCFGIGSSIAILAGGLYTIYSKSTDPSNVTLYQSILLFAMVLVGGINTIRGSILGGLMIVAVPRILEYGINNPASSFYATQLIQLVYGALLIVIIRFLPQGIMGVQRSWFYSSDVK